MNENDIANGLSTHGTLSVDLPDGSTVEWTVTSEPDQDMTIRDEQGEGMWCGRIEEGQDTDYGPVRPDDFTGRSERLDNSLRGGWRGGLWWDVPADIELGSDVHRSLRQSIVDLLEYGYVTVVVTAEHVREDGYSRDAVAMSGGVEWNAIGDVCMLDLVSECLAELDMVS